MAIYPALYSWLVGPGLPLDHLYFKRLPKDNPTGKDVVVAVILAPGSSEPEKHIGRRDLADQGDSITDDGGILWVSTGLLFQVRADKGFEVMADHVINRVMRRMLMIQGERVLPEATDVEPFSTWEATFGIRLERERLFYVELIDSPSDEEQDTKERIVTRLEMDVRHYAVPLPLQAVGTLVGSASLPCSMVGLLTRRTMAERPEPVVPAGPAPLRSGGPPIRSCRPRRWPPQTSTRMKTARW